MLYFVVTLLKTLSIAATMWYGVQGLAGNTTNPDGSLTPQGRRKRRGLIVSGSIALVLLSAETTIQQEQRKNATGAAKEQAQRDSVNLMKQDSVLTRTERLADNLTSLRNLSTEAAARESTHLARTVELAGELNDNSARQGTLLEQQAATLLTAARGQYRLNRPRLYVKFEYPLSTPSVRESLEGLTDRWASEAHALFQEFAEATDKQQLANGAIIHSATGVYGREGGYLMIPEEHVTIFGIRERRDGTLALSLDSLRIESGSRWLDAAPRHLLRARFSIAFSAAGGGDISRTRGDLIYNVRAFGVSSDGSKLSVDTANPEPSSIGVHIDYSRQRIRQEISTTHANAQSNERVSSLLDLPGGVMIIRPPVFGRTLGRPVNVALSLDEGNGRHLTFEGHRFTRRERPHGYIAPLTVADIEVFPGEFRGLYKR